MTGITGMSDKTDKTDKTDKMDITRKPVINKTVIMRLPILDKYIAKQVIASILVVALALLGLDLFFNLVNELKIVGRGQYTISAAIAYLVLSAPTRLYIMFPWAALIGALISLGALANHSELVVMRTATISVLRITWSVLKAALILTVLMVLIGEWIAPFTERLAQSHRSTALSGGQSIQTAEGLWVRQGVEFIHVQTVLKAGDLLGVTRYQFDKDRQLKEVTFAARAVIEGKQWRLFEVKGTQFEANKTKVFQNNEQLIPSLLEPVILETATIKHPERLSLPSLWKTIRHRAKNELNTQSYELAFWSKLLQPIVIMLMVFLAVPFVFGPLRSVSMGFRVLVGILVAFLFHTLNGLFAPLAVVYQFPPFLAVLFPIALFWAIGFWMLKRVR